MEFALHVLITITIYTVLAVSLDLLVGHTGLVSLSTAALYGIGAYTSAILTSTIGLPFLWGMLGGVACAALLSLPIGWSALRLRDDYFVMATFAFQMIIFDIFNNSLRLTRGPLGISNIAHPSLAGWLIDSHARFLMLTAPAAVAAYLLLWRISASPFGRVLHAVREDSDFAESLGKDSHRFKLIIVLISGALAGLAGSFYAHYITYIDPSSFTVMESIAVLSMVIVGGAGTLWGPLLGATLLVSLPEVLRLVGLPDSVAANVRQILYGALLLFVLAKRHRGLTGRGAVFG
jgi:branched-chain amino acid transport system permease protein